MNWVEIVGVALGALLAGLGGGSILERRRGLKGRKGFEEAKQEARDEARKAE